MQPAVQLTQPPLLADCSLQEVGDFENWVKVMEWDMQAVAQALESAAQAGSAGGASGSAAGSQQQ